MNKSLSRLLILGTFAGFFLTLWPGNDTSLLAESPDFTQIHNEYLKLRNTDPSVQELRKWRELGSNMQQVSQSRLRADESARVKFDASIVYEKLYRRSDDSRDIQTAVRLLEGLVTDSSSDLADDALIRLGDLYRVVLHDERAAVSQYEAVLKRFPKSDSAILARHRLQPSAEVDQDATRTKRDGTLSIVLDPGHGGEDFGAKGFGGLLEKDITLLLSKRIAEILRRDPLIEVMLTRQDDSFVPLVERTSFANERNADLFVSLHANASEHADVSGFEVYYLDNSDDQATKKLVERENGSDVGSGSDLAFILGDLIQTGKIESSVKVARSVYDFTKKGLSGAYPPLKWIGVKKAPFYVLVGAHMPCVLVEMFFIDHPSDARLVVQPKFRESLASALATGIRNSLGEIHE